MYGSGLAITLRKPTHLVCTLLWGIRICAWCNRASFAKVYVGEPIHTDAHLRFHELKMAFGETRKESTHIPPGKERVEAVGAADGAVTWVVVIRSLDNERLVEISWREVQRFTGVHSQLVLGLPHASQIWTTVALPDEMGPISGHVYGWVHT
jgi:hypothetical protein